MTADVDPAAWAKPRDLDCLGFEDGHTWPSIYRHETDDYSAPLYSQATVDTLRAQLEAAEAERDRWYAQSELHKHMVITCGVAATHSDPNLTLTGAYKEKWNSQQADSVRALRARAERLAEALRERVAKWREQAAREKARRCWVTAAQARQCADDIEALLRKQEEGK